MAGKRQRSSGPRGPSAGAEGNGPHADRTRSSLGLATTPSGNVVAVGMPANATIHCAGMALLRVFQGHVELLGWTPALGTYYAIHSPKWSSLIGIRASPQRPTTGSGENKRPEHLLGAEFQATFGEVNARLSARMQTNERGVIFDLEEEQVADRLARGLAESFPIVLVFRAVPVTHGNVMCYYELPSKDDVVLPGFKIIVTKDEHQLMLAECPAPTTTTPTASPASGTSGGHAAKSESQLLQELVVAEPSRTIHISTGWEAAADTLERSLLSDDTPQRVVICGGKDVGKSTFCRYLVNRLLSYYDVVAFLDTDLGQPELTPPGLVSLHALVGPLLGPGFTHMKTPLRSFFCGGTNPGTNPLGYVKAVKSLLQLYERKWGTRQTTPAGRGRSVVPLVINTDGWVKSMGHDLLCSVIQDAEPHHVVQLLSTTKSKQFIVPTTGRWRVHSVEPWDPVATTTLAPRSSKEMRLYRLHSYFLGQSPCRLPRFQLQNLHFLTEKDRLSDEMARAYGAMRPFAVGFDAVDVAFTGTPVPPSQLLYSLNCSVVGLCINGRRPPHRHLGAGEEDDGVPPTDEAGGLLTPPRVELAAPHAPCVGIGLVRSIDAHRRILHILSPLPAALMQEVNLLLRGSISVDALLMSQERAVPTPYVVLDVVPSEGTGSGAMQSRNNIKRKRDDGGKGGK